MTRSYTGDPRLDEIIARELRYGQTRWTEVWLSVIMVALGLVLMNDDPTFNGPAFSIIRGIVAEETAAIVALTTGTARLSALWVNGRFRRSPLIRVVGCAGGFLFFAALALGVFLAPGPISTGVAVYGTLSIAELHASSRAARDAFAYDSLGTRKRGRARDGSDDAG